MRACNNPWCYGWTAAVLAVLFTPLSLNAAADKVITATGTVEPEEIVDVGAQVTGMITSLGADPDSPGKTIDFGSRVEVGTVLARIDDAIYRAQVEIAQADCQRAEAELALAHAKPKAWQRRRAYRSPSAEAKLARAGGIEASRNQPGLHASSSRRSRAWLSIAASTSAKTWLPLPTLQPRS